MADELLSAIDEAFDARLRARAARAERPNNVVPFFVAEGGEQRPVDSTHARLGDRIPWIEIFFGVQFLWGALMFIPGIQPYRGLVRSLPYLSSVGLLALYMMRRAPGPLPQSSTLVVSALLLLVLNLLHATSQLTAGLAQCVFQLSIAAPLFWAYKTVHSPKHVERLILFIFVTNCASAGLGILQVYFPERFMPPAFNSLGMQLNHDYVDSLTYIGNNGRAIIRPPGLTDQPGGAAVAGALTALLGLGLLLRARKPVYVIGILGAIAVGLAVVYLTQVRSVLLVAIAAGALLCLIAFRQGRAAGAIWVLGVGCALIVASFSWASSLGGAAVNDRFLNLQGRGALQAYQENRGSFLADTVGNLLSEFPLGAGVGRWGMMNTYFGNPAEIRSTPIHVEIQLTGWLLDGGVPMWMLYGGAILLALWSGLRLTAAPNPFLADMALVVLTVQVFIVGFAMAGPVFNTQLGILFWTLGSMLHGAGAIAPGVGGGEGAQ